MECSDGDCLCMNCGCEIDENKDLEVGLWEGEEMNMINGVDNGNGDDRIEG